MNVPAKFAVHIFTCSRVNRGSQKLGRSLAMTTLYPPLPPPPKNPMATIHYRLFIYVHSFSREYRLQFCVGLRTSNFGEGEVVGVQYGIPFERPLVSSHIPSIHIIPQSALVCLPEILDCSFEWGLRTPNVGEGEAVWDRGWHRSKRALVSSYKPSIVTFLLSLRVSETLPLLFRRTPLFPSPLL